MAINDQFTRDVQQQVDDVTQDIRKLGSASAAGRRVPLYPPDDRQPTMPETIAQRSNNTLDLVTLHTIEKIDGLVKTLTDLKDLLIDDCARAKLEIQSHIETADAASTKVDDISAWVKDIRADRARKINVRTIDQR